MRNPPPDPLSAGSGHADRARTGEGPRPAAYDPRSRGFTANELRLPMSKLPQQRRAREVGRLAWRSRSRWCWSPAPRQPGWQSIPGRERRMRPGPGLADTAPIRRSRTREAPSPRPIRVGPRPRTRPLPMATRAPTRRPPGAARPVPSPAAGSPTIPTKVPAPRSCWRPGITSRGRSPPRSSGRASRLSCWSTPRPTRRRVIGGSRRAW